MTDSPASRSAIETRVEDVLRRYRSPVLAGMRAALDRPGVAHVRYMRYHLGWEDAAGNPIDAGAGKMLRPAFCLLCCEAARGSAERAMPAAVAIELLHNFTLIHDDIEDASDTRHGRPTLWRIAGTAQAINAGDGLFVLAQRTLLDLQRAGVPPERVLDAARTLDEACIELCEGQHLDLGFEARTRVSRREYEAMIAGKTAALLGAAAAIGAIAAGAPPEACDAFARCGRLLGLAFQAQDDVLGIWGDPALTRKPVGDDIRAKKKSFPVVYAFDRLEADELAQMERIYGEETIAEADVERVMRLLERAGAREAVTAAARRWADEALAAVAPLRLDDERRRDIDALARFFVERAA